jgi:hypothetical protein
MSKVPQSNRITGLCVQGKQLLSASSSKQKLPLPYKYADTWYWGGGSNFGFNLVGIPAVFQQTELIRTKLCVYIATINLKRRATVDHQ